MVKNRNKINFRIMKKTFLLSLIALFSVVSFSSCSDDDERDASVLSGEWQGDWNMWYEDSYGRVWYASDTYIRFDRSNTYRGTGTQVDYYDHGPYRTLNYRFYWEVRNGVIYLTYPSAHELDVDIYDYHLTGRYFDGYFGYSHASFTMDKISNFHYWVPEVWVDDWYGYTLYIYGSPQHNGGVESKGTMQTVGAVPSKAVATDSLPTIVRRGGHAPRLDK